MYRNTSKAKERAEGMILILFGVIISALTVYSAAGIDPTNAAPSRETTPAQRQLV